MTKQLRLNLPTLPNFNLTDAEIQQALDTPVREKHRFGEITIQPEGERPRLSNRLLVYAYELYMQDKPMEFASLMKGLFLLWAMGKLVVLEDGMTVQSFNRVISQSAETSDEWEAFDLSDLTVDMSADLPDEYDFGGLKS